jgi:O-succinylbenzoate synthase
VTAVVHPFPELDDLLARAHVVTVPLTTRFRGVTEREAVLIEGPAGWGEFAPFVEYDDIEASRWLAAAVESAWAEPVPAVRDVVPVNASLPAVPADRVPAILAAFDGCTTAKVKVAERGQRLADDVARVAEVRSVLGPAGRIRVDANGAWDVETARRALSALARFGLEYAEQPCASLADLRQLRTALAVDGVDVPIAADESVRKASDPLRVAVAGAADVVVLKVAPLGGVRAGLRVAERLGSEIGLGVVVSSALDTSVGLAAGVELAAALPELPYACGLGTACLLADDVTLESLRPRGGRIPVRRITAEPRALGRLAASPGRRNWWRERLVRCHGLLDTAGMDLDESTIW